MLIVHAIRAVLECKLDDLPAFSAERNSEETAEFFNLLDR